MRIVIKVGSNLLVNKQGEIEKPVIIELARQISTVIAEGNQVCLVTSGARASGIGRLRSRQIDSDLYISQALCAIGQVELMNLYANAFAFFDLSVAQILLTREDFGLRKRFLNLRNTLIGLLEIGVVPIINENDTVATEEITLGDNDVLASMFSIGWNADLLLLMTSVDGVLDRDGNVIDNFTGAVELKTFASTSWGKGGIHSKINMARAAASVGVKATICNGRKLSNISEITHGKRIGTTFEPMRHTSSKKAWIGFLSRLGGAVHLDEGATKAVLSQKSLLPVGVTSLEGQFKRGDVIEIYSAQAEKIARGISNYSAIEAVQVIGKNSEEINHLLLGEIPKTLIHKDNLILL